MSFGHEAESKHSPTHWIIQHRPFTFYAQTILPPFTYSNLKLYPYTPSLILLHPHPFTTHPPVRQDIDTQVTCHNCHCIIYTIHLNISIHRDHLFISISLLQRIKSRSFHPSPLVHWIESIKLDLYTISLYSTIRYDSITHTA